VVRYVEGNSISKAQLVDFEGFERFLERRAKTKDKDLQGGALADHSLCGLD